MRGKRAKQLRHIAELSTVGKPEIAYTMVRGHIEMMQMCTRKVYKTMKKKFKQGTPE